MNQKIITSLITLGLLTLTVGKVNGQVFELQNNNTTHSINTTETEKSNSNSEEDVIVDKSDDEVIIPAQVIPQSDKWTSLVQSKERDYSAIEQALKEGQNANQGIFDGSSMLSLAAWQNDATLFKLGLQYGASVSNTNKNGETTLHWAAYSNNSSIINMALADKSALKIINKQNKTGRTALHFNALQWGNVEVAKALIAQKADLNIKDSNGQTPLHYAVVLRKWALVKLYIDAGADTSLKDKGGDGLDEYLMSKGDIEGFMLLYKYLNPTNQAIIRARLATLNLTP